MTKRPAKKPVIVQVHPLFLVLRRWIIGIGSMAAALLAIGSFWIAVGWPRIATSADIQKLNAAQTDLAVDLYQKNVRDALISRSAVKNDPSTQALVDQNLREAQDKLKAAQDRKLELAK